MHVPQKMRDWLNKPWLAYFMLCLLQLKVVWGMWSYRDLTSGDTSGYFNRAYLWFTNYSVDIIWSPLYTAFYGSLLHLSTNAYVVTILHRLIIVFVASTMVLALMRRLLPHALAWLVAAWWVVLPVNFDALYEVHLFTVIPLLAAYLLILYKPSPWTRSGAIAILVVTTVLVRNELSIAVGILALICLIWELRQIRATRNAGGTPRRLWAYLAIYGLPLLAACAICLFFYSRSIIQFPQLTQASAPKHTVNMCQVYASGYLQRHPEWNKSPWTQCEDLMQADFGAPLLPLTEMIRRNPRAVFENMLWNVSLTPNGIQVLLFNATSGTVTPDYIPVKLRSTAALILSIITSIVLILGLTLLYRERRFWWEYWLKERAWGWIAMLSVITIAFVIIPTQRPRPSYLFSLSIFLMALTGMCVFVIIQRWSIIDRISAWLPVAMLAILLIVPGFYLAPGRNNARSLLQLYQRLTPFEQAIDLPSTSILVSGYSMDVDGYINHQYGRSNLKIADYAIINELPASMPLETFLDQRGINMIYVDEGLWSRLESVPIYEKFLRSPAAAGWEPLALQNSGAERWMLLQKMTAWYESPAKLRQLSASADIGPDADAQILATNDTLPADGLFVGHYWYGLERAGTTLFRWVNNDAEIVLAQPSGTKHQLRLELEPGPGMTTPEFELQIVDQAGKIVARADVRGHSVVTVDVPITAQRSTVLRLHVEGGGKASTNGDPRILNFRVFKFAWN